MKQPINVLDLFCGAGGLSCGFEKAGFNILLGIDSDEHSLKTFKKNHPQSEIISGDISKVTPKEILVKINNKPIDIIIGGPPCQGFSMAGNRNPLDPRNNLILNYLQLVINLKPKVFVIENVPGLLSMKNEDGKKIIDIVKELSQKSGYFIKEYLLKAEEFGVPQKRRRIILVGSKDKNLSLIFKKSKIIPVKKVLLDKNQVPKSFFYSPKSIAGFKKKEIVNKKLGRGFGWQILDPEKPSYTIRARYYKDGSEALVRYSEDEIRMLTPPECAAIQSFPKNYKFEGSKMQIYKQIGNAVPPKLAYAIAKSIKGAISN